MFEKLREVKIHITLSALATLALGVVLVIWPGETALLFDGILSVALLVVGVILLILSVRGFKLGIPGALMLLVVGIWSFANPEAIAEILPVAAGVLMVTHGVQDLVMTPALKRYHADNWWLALIFSLLSIAFGVLCIAKAFGVVKVIMVIVGLMLIYDGITDLVLIHKYNYFRRQMEKAILIQKEREALEEAAVDVEFKEVGRESEPVPAGEPEEE